MYVLWSLLLLARPAQSFLPQGRFPDAATVLEASTSDSCDVAIMGGGFGGLYAALAISREARRRGRDLDVVLVEPTESFVFLPLLYDLTVGTATEAEVCPAYSDLLADTGVRQVRASLESFAPNNPQAAVLKPSSPLSPSELSFRASVVSVGASADSILARVPGATEFVQPFYTEEDAKSTRRLLARLEDQVSKGEKPRVAIVGGGFGGVELAASVQRKISSASVTLLSRGAPMAGTRAEPLIDKALQKLGVKVEQCSVDAIEPATKNGNNPPSQPVIVKTTKWNSDDEESSVDLRPWDVVMWTAGSSPAFPVSEGLSSFRKADSGRLAIDCTLRCFLYEDKEMIGDSADDLHTVESAKYAQPPVWALGDCAEIVSINNEPAVPKTAQAAMQQADVVAFNLLAQLEGGKATTKNFQFQDLGSMMSLGGPNAALMAPKEGSLAPLFTPVLDTVGGALSFADKMLGAAVGQVPMVEKLGLDPDTLGLSLGSYGIGVDTGAAPGTLAGTLTGAARRAVYAARMPTNEQRAVAATSAAISTAAALAKEAATRNQKYNNV